MNYAQSLRYLEQVQTLGIKFGLDNVRAVLSQLGNPERAYPSVIVAGSNGKGSVCAMLDRIVTVHGKKPGLYTSPHLLHPEERIRVNSIPVGRELFSRCLSTVRAAIDGLIARGTLLTPPTYFETTTCLASVCFRELKVDMAFLEVGMGGRFDATNAVKPILSVITTISAEHQKFLGDTLGQIAFEKAGIISGGVPVVCGVEPDEAYSVIRDRAEELGAPFVSVWRDGRSLKALKEKFGYSFKYGGDSSHAAYDFTPSLPGLHQGKNAATAIRAAEEISRLWKPLREDKVVEGIESAAWPGRLEHLDTDPPVVLDGAHNPEGAEALRAYAEAFLPRPVTLIFAAMRDKDVGAVAGILFPAADRILLTTFPYFKARTPEELLAFAPVEQRARCALQPDLRSALMEAAPSLFDRGKSGGPAPRGSLLIAGSLFLIGEAKKILESAF